MINKCFIFIILIIVLMLSLSIMRRRVGGGKDKRKKRKKCKIMEGESSGEDFYLKKLESLSPFEVTPASATTAMPTKPLPLEIVNTVDKFSNKTGLRLIGTNIIGVNSGGFAEKKDIPVGHKITKINRQDVNSLKDMESALKLNTEPDVGFTISTSVMDKEEFVNVLVNKFMTNLKLKIEFINANKYILEASKELEMSEMVELYDLLNKAKPEVGEALKVFKKRGEEIIRKLNYNKPSIPSIQQIIDAYKEMNIIEVDGTKMLKQKFNNLIVFIKSILLKLGKDSVNENKLEDMLLGVIFSSLDEKFMEESMKIKKKVDNLLEEAVKRNTDILPWDKVIKGIEIEITPKWDMDARYKGKVLEKFNYAISIRWNDPKDGGPKKASIKHLTNEEDILSYYKDMQPNLKEGDTIVYRSWWESGAVPVNTVLKWDEIVKDLKINMNIKGKSDVRAFGTIVMRSEDHVIIRWNESDDGGPPADLKIPKEQGISRDWWESGAKPIGIWDMPNSSIVASIK